ncbi:MAG: efflux transporter outer membrane subunit [Sumerlaeia bacterium]
MPSKSLVIATICIFATACTVGPNYQPPEITPPQQFLTQEVLQQLGETNDQAFPLNWWEGFNDSTLSKLVESALQDNYELGIAAANYRQALSKVKEAAAGNKPRLEAGIDASADERRELNEDQERTNTVSTFGVLGFVIPLDVFGKTTREVESANANVQALEAELQRLSLQVSSQVVQEYMALRGNQRQLELLRESVTLQEKTLSIVTTRYETGLSPELDVRRAETSVERLKADIPPLQESLFNSRNRLAVLAGQYPGVYEALLTPLQPATSYNAEIPQVLPLDVLRARPDIQRAEARMREAVAQVGVEEADLYPSFQLGGQIQLGTNMVSSQPPVELLIASLNAAVTQVIFDGGERRAQIEIAITQAEASVLEYRQALLLAVEEVEASLYNLDASRRTQQALQNAVNSSTRSFSQAEILYQQGLISFLDVVDSQRVLADAEQDLAAEQTRYATQIARLFQTIGSATPPMERQTVELPVEPQDD